MPQPLTLHDKLTEHKLVASSQVDAAGNVSHVFRGEWTHSYDDYQLTEIVGRLQPQELVAFIEALRQTYTSLLYEINGNVTAFWAIENGVLKFGHVPDEVLTFALTFGNVADANAFKALWPWK